MRLIDADALSEVVEDMGERFRKRFFVVTAKAYSEIPPIVNAMPTIDAVEVVHGRWIKQTTDCVYYYACSECGEPVLRSQWGSDFFSEYCPNCGAKMDGERKDE